MRSMDWFEEQWAKARQVLRDAVSSGKPDPFALLEAVGFLGFDDGPSRSTAKKLAAILAEEVPAGYREQLAEAIRCLVGRAQDNGEMLIALGVAVLGLQWSKEGPPLDIRDVIAY
jgi:hypothetical protein